LSVLLWNETSLITNGKKRVIVLWKNLLYRLSRFYNFTFFFHLEIINFIRVLFLENEKLIDNGLFRFGFGNNLRAFVNNDGHMFFLKVLCFPENKGFLHFSLFCKAILFKPTNNFHNFNQELIKLSGVS